MNPTDPTAGSAPGSALPQKAGETREVSVCACCGALWPCPHAGLYPHRPTTAKR